MKGQSLEELARLLREGNRKDKIEALKQLVRSGRKDAGKILVSALKNESDEELQSQIRKGIHSLKKRLVGQKNASSEKASQSRTSFEDWIVSGDSVLEKQALQHVFRSRDTEELKKVCSAALTSQRTGFAKGCIKLMERWLPEELPWLTFPFICLEDESVHQAAFTLLHFSRSANQLLKKEEWIRDAESEVLYQLRQNLDSPEGQKMPLEFKSLVQEEIRRRERPELEVTVEMDPDLLPKTKDEAREDAEAKRKQRQSQMTKITRLRNQLDQTEKAEEILKIFRELGELKDAGSNESIIQKIAVSSSPAVIAGGLKALGHSGSEAAVVSIQPWLSHKEASIRLEAAQALGLLLEDRPKPMLEPLLKDPDPGVQAAVIRGIYPTHQTQCFLPLSSLSNSQDPDANKAALQTIAFLGEDNLLVMVQKLMKKDSMKARALEVLKQWKGSPEASRFLIEDPTGDFPAFLRTLEEKKQKQEEEKLNQGSLQDGDSEETDEDSDGKTGLIGGFLSRLRRKS